MPESKSPKGDECSCVILGADDDAGGGGDDDLLVSVAALRLRAERMLEEAPGEKASTKTMLVLQIENAARTFKSIPTTMYSDAIWSGVCAMFGECFARSSVRLSINNKVMMAPQVDRRTMLRCCAAAAMLLLLLLLLLLPLLPALLSLHQALVPCSLGRS